MRVLALHGLKGVGKDTVGAYLVDSYGCTSVAMASKLKSFLEAMNPLVLSGSGFSERLNTLILFGSGDWDEAKRENEDVRRLLTSTGEAMKAVFGQDVWVNELLRSLDHMEEQDWGALERLVITDLRFPTELDVLREAFEDDLIAIKITRPGHVPDGHVSEDGLPDSTFNYIVDNDGSVLKLYAAIDRIMGEIQ